MTCVRPEWAQRYYGAPRRILRSSKRMTYPPGPFPGREGDSGRRTPGLGRPQGTPLQEAVALIPALPHEEMALDSRLRGNDGGEAGMTTGQSPVVSAGAQWIWLAEPLSRQRYFLRASGFQRKPE